MKKFKRIMSVLLSLTIMLTVFSLAQVTVNAASDVVERAISWAVAIANDNSHGYSQQSRWGPDYDCSSLVIAAFKNAGVDTGTATYTGNMRSQFTAHGFQWIPWSSIGGTSNLQRGDILLNERTHTEIYLGNNQNVGAHSNRGYPQTGDQTGTEVSVSGYYYHPWDGVLRYAGGSTPCSCSADYAGDYIVNTNSQPLTMRSGHGTGYGVVTTIPKGAQVYVSKSDGSWAHVEWNGYTGYCSMEYLKKMENRNFNLHVWVSDTGMGSVPSNYHTGTRYYICYELIDLSTGQRATNISINAKETVRNSSGVVFEHTYENSNNNWISFVPDSEDTYTGTVTITGDTDLSCGVSFEAWADTKPSVKIWAWEGDQSNEISSLGVGQTAYISYLIRDNNTKSNLNDVTTYWNQGDGYTVRLEIRTTNNVLLESKTYKNNDSAWISFKPSSLGEYKLNVIVSGNMSGSQEKTFTAIEKEHSYGSWKTTQPATCTTAGTKTRECVLCGHKETQTISATGHSYGSWTTTKAATCTVSGTKTRTCSSCGNKETQTISATGHQYTTTVIAPTTTSQGYTLHKCSVCGNSYKDTYTDQLKPSNPDAPQIIVENKTAGLGSKVDVDISLKNNPGIVGMTLDVKYDSSALKLVEVKDKGVLGTNSHKPELRSPYTLSWSNDTSTTNYSVNGTIVTLTFEVSETVPEGQYPISIIYDFDNMDIYNKDIDKVKFEVVNGIINVTKTLCGDVNNDGKVNNLDRVYITRYLAKWDEYQNINLSAADVNLDGNVNNLDKVILTRHLAKWDEYSTLPYKK